MPRDSNGNFSLVPSYLATTGQTITVSQYNPVVEDVAAALTGSLPRNGVAPMLANLPMGGFKITGLANGTVPTDAATVAQVSGTTPIGVVQDYALGTLPAGWLWCDGSVLLPSTPYTALRNALIADGFTYEQDGSGNPLLPDCRGRTRVGKDRPGGPLTFIGVIAQVLGSVFGTASHVLTVAQLAAHTHSVSGSTSSGGAHTHSVNSQQGGDLGGQFVNRSTNGANTAAISPINSDGVHSHSISGTADSQGSNVAHPNVQPSIVFNTIIRAV